MRSPARAPALALLLLVAAMAGCTAAPQAPPPAQPPDASDPDPAPGETTDAGAAVAPGPFAAREASLWFTADRALALEAPSAAGTVAESFLFFDPRFQAGQQEVPVWRGPALAEGWRVTQARLDLWFTTQGPQQDTAATAGFTPVTVWYGPDGPGSPTMQIPAPSTLAPGEVAHVEADLLVPPGGYVFAPGAGPHVMLLFGYTQSDANPIHVLTGGEQATRLVLTVEPFLPVGPLVAQEVRYGGTFAPNTFLVPNPDPAAQVAEVALEVPPGTARIEALLAGTTAAGAHDLDLELRDPAGQRVWASSTPRASEGLRLDGSNLAAGPGVYTLRVLHFQGVQSTWELAVRLHTRPPGGVEAAPLP